MTGDDRRWLEMTGDNMRWQEMTGDDRSWQEMTGDDRRWQEMTGGNRRWQEVTGDDRIWQEVTGGDRRWMGVNFNIRYYFLSNVWFLMSNVCCLRVESCNVLMSEKQPHHLSTVMQRNNTLFLSAILEIAYFVISIYFNFL